MANFFEGVWEAAKHPFEEIGWMWDSTKGVLTGDKKLKDIPGDHQEMMNDITVPILGNNKLAKNSDAVAGAVVGGILAAPVIGGAMSGAGSGASSGFGGFGTEGAFSKYFNPVSNKVGGWWDSVAGPSDDILGNLADMEAGGAVNADLGLGSDALKKAGGGKDMSAIAQMLQSVKPQQQHQISHSGGRSGGGFRFDQGQYKNQLAQREFDQMYGAQPYNPLV